MPAKNLCDPAVAGPTARSRNRAIVLVAALAVADMAAHFAPSPISSVKWPNDVLAMARSSPASGWKAAKMGQGRWLAVGIGQSGELSARHRISCHVLWRNWALRRVIQGLSVLAARFAHWYDAWMSEGLKGIAPGWRGRRAGHSIPRPAAHGANRACSRASMRGACCSTNRGQSGLFAAGEVFSDAARHRRRQYPISFCRL
jgi:BirA family biotin operon repressor/biotin-[acetyl-CoA-carboxylase] ligase